MISLQPKDSQKSSPAAQFQSIDSSALSLPYGLTLTFIHDYWKNYSFDYMDICWQSRSESFSCPVVSDSLRPPWSVAHQTFLSTEFSRQDYLSGLPFLSLGDLHNPGTEPRSPALQADSSWSEPPEMSLLFNMLSKSVIAFLPRRKRLSVSQLQSLSVVILEPKKIKSVMLLIFPLLFDMK